MGWGRIAKQLLGGLGSALAMAPNTHITKKGAVGARDGYEKHCKVGWGRVAKQLLGGLGSALAMPTKNCKKPRTSAMSAMKTAKSLGRLLCLL